MLVQEGISKVFSQRIYPYRHTDTIYSLFFTANAPESPANDEVIPPTIKKSSLRRNLLLQGKSLSIRDLGKKKTRFQDSDEHSDEKTEELMDIRPSRPKLTRGWQSERKMSSGKDKARSMRNLMGSIKTIEEPSDTDGPPIEIVDRRKLLRRGQSERINSSEPSYHKEMGRSIRDLKSMFVSDSTNRVSSHKSPHNMSSFKGHLDEIDVISIAAQKIPAASSSYRRAAPLPPSL